MGSSKYSVTFVNDSSNVWNVCLYQTDPDVNVTGVQSLVWLASPVPIPKSSVFIFEWTVDYAFAWADTGPIAPGVVFAAAQLVEADSKVTNEVTFTCADGTYELTDPNKGPLSGSLRFIEDSTISPDKVSIGLAMSEASVFALQAQPNLHVVFKLGAPVYWISFGVFTTGQVLDIDALPDAAQIEFPTDVFEMKATMNADNSWTIAPSLT